MLEFSKKILNSVSFDKNLFKKELYKNIGWLDKKEIILLKIWALATFTQYKKTILDGYDQVISKRLPCSSLDFSKPKCLNALSVA